MKNGIKKTANESLTELVFIIDRSGSMGGLEDDTIGGFNSMIADHKGKDGRAYVTTVLFDNEFETLHDRVEISEVKPMTKDDYFVRGSTALLDAVGSTVEHISKIHRYARAEDVPGRTLVVITTDGMENSSRHYGPKDVKRLIGAKREEGWEFIFVGANIDAVETASDYGIDREHALNYHADKKGTKKIYEALSRAVGCAMNAEPIGDEWRCDADRDFKERR